MRKVSARAVSSPTPSRPLPLTPLATRAQTRNMPSSPWHPIRFAITTLSIGFLFTRETKGIDIHAQDQPVNPQQGHRL